MLGKAGLGVRFLGRHKRTKTFSDGTKLLLVVARPKTTTYGMKLLFSPELGQPEWRQFASSAS